MQDLKEVQKLKNYGSKLSLFQFSVRSPLVGKPWLLGVEQHAFAWNQALPPRYGGLFLHGSWDFGCNKLFLVGMGFLSRKGNRCLMICSFRSEERWYFLGILFLSIGKNYIQKKSWYMSVMSTEILHCIGIFTVRICLEPRCSPMPLLV